MGDAELSQLHLVSLHFLGEWPDQSFPPSRCHQRLQSAYQPEEPKPSQLERDVAAVLDRLGWTHVFEQETTEGLSLDMAKPATKRAIEVDGPSHFAKNTASTTYVENGATRFKSRLLRRLGWDVVCVPFNEGDRLQTPVEQDAYFWARGLTPKRPRLS